MTISHLSSSLDDAIESRTIKIVNQDAFAGNNNYVSTISKGGQPIVYKNNLQPNQTEQLLGGYVQANNFKNQEIKIQNSQNQVTVLNSTNISSMGVQYPIDTTTFRRFEAIMQQKHNEYDTMLSLFDIKIEGLNQRRITVPRIFKLGGNAEAGLTDLVGQNRKQTTQLTQDFVDYKMAFWTGSLGYDIMSVGVAEAAGFPNMVAELEAAQYENFQIMLSKILAVGDSSGLGLEGILNLVNSVSMPIQVSNTIMSGKSLSKQTPTEFNKFLSESVGFYLAAIKFAGENNMMYPDTLIISPDDKAGLGGFVDGGAFGFRTKLEALENTFKAIHPDFKIVESIFTKGEFNGLGHNRYALMNRRSNAFKVSFGRPYTSTIVGSMDNFSFNNVQMAQFSGVQGTRPLIAYFDFATQ